MMESAIRKSVYNGLVDSLHVAIDTGNDFEVVQVLLDSDGALALGQIDSDQFAQLVSEAQDEGYEYV